MTDIWVVIVEERDAAVDVLPCSSKGEAIRVARVQVERLTADPGLVVWDAPLSLAAVEDGWVFVATVGLDGDCVGVVKRTLDGHGP